MTRSDSRRQRQLMTILLRSWHVPARFVIAGVANTAMCYLVIWVAHDVVRASVWLASAAGYVVGTIQSFVLNRHWTFSGRQTSSPLAVQALLFVAVYAACGLVFSLINTVLARSLPLLLSTVIASALVVPLSFALNHQLVFRSIT